MTTSWQLTDLRPSDGIRWAVGAVSARRSATWRFWGNKKGDFYLAVRALGGVWKASLHKDGRCHIGATSEYAAKHSLEPRLKDRWQLDIDTPQIAIQIFFPEAYLSEFAQEEAEPMRWLPGPGSGTMSVSTIYTMPAAFASQLGNSWPAAEHGAVPIGVAGTRDRMAFVVQTETPLDQAQQSAFESDRLRAIEQASQEGVVLDPGARGILFGTRDSGSRFMTDLTFS